jgi:hypothetical protein
MEAPAPRIFTKTVEFKEDVVFEQDVLCQKNIFVKGNIITAHEVKYLYKGEPLTSRWKALKALILGV